MRNLDEIEFETAGVETESAVSYLETKIGVAVPNAFRRHLLRHGGGYMADCIAPCKVPTPFGEHTICEIAGTELIMSELDSDIIPRNMVLCGIGNLGKWTCISIAGLDHGKIYAFDSEMRFYWTQEEINARPFLDPSIIEFFRLRDNNELPDRPWGYENCYEVADDFDGFIDILEVLE